MTSRSSFKRKANNNAEPIIDGLHNLKRSVLEAVAAATLRSSPTAVVAAENVLHRKNKKAKKEEFPIRGYLSETDDENYSIDREDVFQYRDSFSNCNATGFSRRGCIVPFKFVDHSNTPEKQEQPIHRDALSGEACPATGYAPCACVISCKFIAPSNSMKQDPACNDKDDNAYDWSAFRDDSDHIYYHNIKTNETTWEPPANNEPFNLVVPEEDEDEATNDDNTIDTYAADGGVPAL